MSQKAFMKAFETTFTSWLQHVNQKIQIDYQTETGASLNEATLTMGSGGAIFQFTVPDRKDLNIKTQDQEVWIPATMYPTKDKDGRPTMRKRKGYKRTQKVELKENESSPTREDGKQAQTGSVKGVKQKIVDYHFKKDFSDFLIKNLSGKEFTVKRRN
jgi:hypothetical protein